MCGQSGLLYNENHYQPCVDSLYEEAELNVGDKMSNLWYLYLILEEAGKVSC